MSLCAVVGGVHSDGVVALRSGYAAELSALAQEPLQIRCAAARSVVCQD